MNRESSDRWSPWRDELRARPRRWLVTGAAGFIGSHLVEALLELDQAVRGFDNFATGHRANLDAVHRRVSEARWREFDFVEGDVRDAVACGRVARNIDIVLHQAALGSVPRSIADPLATHDTNVRGFLHLLVAARENGCARFVFASSSSVYGSREERVRTEASLGEPLSPYAASKRTGELWAAAFRRSYGLATVGLRYFNVFGPRQDPAGAYAAVIPRWIATLRRGEQPVLHGDGTTSRDFCPVANVVRANLLAAGAGEEALGGVFNVGLGESRDLNELYRRIRAQLVEAGVACAGVEPRRADFRRGDVPHSQADLTLARRVLGYRPVVDFDEGLRAAVAGREETSGARGEGSRGGS